MFPVGTPLRGHVNVIIPANLHDRLARLQQQPSLMLRHNERGICVELAVRLTPVTADREHPMMPHTNLTSTMMDESPVYNCRKSPHNRFPNLDPIAHYSELSRISR